jgi:predicted ATPase
MLNSITLANYKSFGAQQTVELGPLTVLVGPNNAGKSAFMSVGAFISNVANFGAKDALTSEGGVDNLVHRPAHGGDGCMIKWAGEAGSYSETLETRAGELVSVAEELTLATGEMPWRTTDKGKEIPGRVIPPGAPFEGLVEVMRQPKLARFRIVLAPLEQSRRVKLSVTALRQDAPPMPQAPLESDGSGLAQAVARWRSSQPIKAQRLDEFVTKCVPDVVAVLSDDAPDEASKPPLPGTKRIVIEQRDGQRFDAKRISDGILCIIAMGMHAIDAGPGSVLFIEEPEQSIHPTLLHSVVDLLRSVVSEQKCQVVLATHSPRLLSEFRETPEHIVVFRRWKTGTQVRKLSELTVLAEALRDPEQEAGAMFEAGLFETAFEQLLHQETSATAAPQP